MQTAMFYLFVLGLIVPPAAVVAGLVMLAIPTKTRPSASVSTMPRAA